MSSPRVRLYLSEYVGERQVQGRGAREIRKGIEDSRGLQGGKKHDEEVSELS